MKIRDESKRVLIVVQNLPLPFDRRVWLEATTLTKYGYVVSVICPKGKGYQSPRECLEDIDIYRYSLPIDAHGKLGFLAEFIWCFIATFLLSARVALCGRGFDILHVCNPPETYWPLALFWRLVGCVFIFDHHDLSPEMAEAKFGRNAVLNAGLLWLEKMTFLVANLVITTNESHKQIAILRGKKKSDDVFIVRSGPELGRFRLFPVNSDYKMEKRYLLVYLGEICQQDGVDHLIMALKILSDEYERRDFHCILVGGGPFQPMVVKYAAEKGVDHLCTFTGRVGDDELCRILSSADVAIDPDPKNSWTDQSTMNKIIEYMYFGLPIVAFDLKEARVSAQEAALFVEPNIEKEMARAIAQLLDDPERRAVMGRYGREKVRKALAWDYSVPTLIAAYERANQIRTRSASGLRSTAYSEKTAEQRQGTEH